MAMQNANGARDSAKASGINTKVNADGGKAMGTKSQPITGGSSTPGMMGAAKGGAVKTVPSQPITGKLGNGSTPMGGDGMLPGKV